MGRSDHSHKKQNQRQATAVDKEVTDGAGEKKDTKAGARTATAADKEVIDSVGETEVTVASDHFQQGPKPETATAVDKEVTNEKKDTDASDFSQTVHVVASEHSQKRPRFRDRDSSS